MSKKVGILTFHRALNYGAVLQSYGLQRFLFENNIDNEIVDYRCEYMENHYQKIIRKTPGNKLKGLLWSLYTAPEVIKSKKSINAFADSKLKLSCPYDKNTVYSIGDKYSKFICGSDQVWSPTCVGFDPVYFLPFGKKGQKYSYAASIATKEIPENIKDEFVKRISDFSGYSLRENSGKKIVEDLTGKEAQVHIDPSLLLTRQQWEELIPQADKKVEPYILLFTILKPVRLIEYALELSKKTGMKIVYLNNHQLKRKGIDYIPPVSPDKFLFLIKNASYICTNSFHGSAFATIFHKNFVVETESKVRKNIRSQELLTDLGLKERLLTNENYPNIDAKSDWEYAEKKIAEEREKSRKYLLSI